MEHAAEGGYDTTKFNAFLRQQHGPTFNLATHIE